GRRGAERRRIGVVVEGEMLGVIPERRDSIAVIVAHHLSLGAEAAGAALGALAGIEREQVHGAVVKGSLLGLIAVVLVGGRRLGAIEAEGFGRIGAVPGIGRIAVTGQQAGR